MVGVFDTFIFCWPLAHEPLCYECSLLYAQLFPLSSLSFSLIIGYRVANARSSPQAFPGFTRRPHPIGSQGVSRAHRRVETSPCRQRHNSPIHVIRHCVPLAVSPSPFRTCCHPNLPRTAAHLPSRSTTLKSESAGGSWL